jgi:hypothetical protein
MSNFMPKKLLVSMTLVAIASAANADTLVRFNFNSNPADASTSTGSIAPSFGAGTASLVGGVTGAFASGVGSTDLTATDNTGWQTTGYAVASTGDKTRGVQFLINTTGYNNVVFSYDLRHSNTSSQWEQVQYTLNGTSFIDIAQFSVAVGDAWANGRTVDLSGIAGVANNANFGVRVLSTFAPSSTNYAASTVGSNYGAAGTWRFDNVAVTGSVVVASVPEADGVAVALAGFAALCFVTRRQRKA